ncbi:hypothetical protein H0H93_002371 [Arthromyces matolae]|nr:hypothetical protein H0H93_002371 [Arthromyces matolae]
MAFVLQNLLKGLSPPPVIVPPEYDGLQYKWKMFVFRPAMFKLELVLLIGIAVYLAAVYLGIQRNKSKDDVTLDFKLAPGALANDFVWAVVAKDELLSIKQNRWDLTFTKTSENPALPSSLSVMSEFADITDNLLKPALVTALSNPKVSPYFRSLSVTDQPRQRPEAPLPAEKRRKHVLLSLSLPSRAQETEELVAALFPFIDSLHNINLRPETKNKLKKVREELDKSLKADAEKEKKEEEQQAAEDRKAAKRKLEEERVAKLPAAEQQKYLEKERKRLLRKAQGKVVRK